MVEGSDGARTPRGAAAAWARARRVTALLLTALVLVVAGGCQDELPEDPPPSSLLEPSTPPEEPSGPAAGKPFLLLSFDSADALLVSSAEGPLDVDVVTWNSGEIRAKTGPFGGVVAFPGHRAEDPRFAVIRVSNSTQRDWLRPKSHNFAFGAAFSLDRDSAQSDADDGDNVIQRGLFDTPSQFKIQVDHGIVSCLVRGMRGEVLVEMKQPVQPERWYRVQCTRQGGKVTMQLAMVEADGSTEWTTVVGRGQIGPVLMPVKTPLSVGGKLAEDGSLTPSSTDQFNGKIDEVFMQLLS